MTAPKLLVEAIERALNDRWEAERLTNQSDPEIDAYVALDAIPDGWAKVNGAWVEFAGLLTDGKTLRRGESGAP